MWFKAFEHPFDPGVDGMLGMPFYEMALELILPFPLWLQTTVSVVIISFEAIYLNAMVTKHEVLYARSYLPALFYVILMSLLPDLLCLHPVVFANMFLLLAINKGFALYKKETAVGLVLEIGIMISVASLFYFPSVVLFLGVISGLILLRPFLWREWVSGFIGFALPYFYLWLYFFWYDHLEKFWNYFSNVYLSSDSGIYFHLTDTAIALIAFVILLFLMSIWTLQSNFLKNVIKTRICQQILFIFLLVGAFSYLLLPKLYLYHFTILAIPLAVFIAYYFLAVKKNWWADILLGLLATGLLFNHWLQ